MHPEYDIIIVGGGLTGASLACCLSGTSARIAVIEAVAFNSGQQPSYDEKGLALSLSSQRIFNAIGIWPRVVKETVPIEHIHVSDSGRFGFVRLHAKELNLPALGYVTSARKLGQVLLSGMEASTEIDLICPAEVMEIHRETNGITVKINIEGNNKHLSGKLLVAAEGTRSRLREQAGIKVSTRDYQQTAIVCNVTPEMSHNNTAYERFTSCGPLALLPLPERRCAAVFTVHSADGDRFLAMSDEEFLVQLERRFGKRLGKFIHMGRRKSYPISLMKAEQQVCERTVFLGNSVHTIHPNGAQGFNLCLRDVAGLAEKLTASIGAGNDPGTPATLENYVRSRQADQRRIIRFSDGLNDLFYNTSFVKGVLRNTGMLVLDILPAVKKEFVQRATGLSGRQSRLVTGAGL